MNLMRTIGRASGFAALAVVGVSPVAAQFARAPEAHVFLEQFGGPLPDGDDFVEGELLVLFEPFAPEVIREFLAHLVDGRTIERFEHLDVDVVVIERGRDVRWAVSELERSPFVRGASPNYRHYPASNHPPIPNDPLFHRQWALDNTGSNMMIGNAPAGKSHVHHQKWDPAAKSLVWVPKQNQDVRGVIDASIDARQAWTFGTDCTGIVVAVIDTGIDVAHPDLVNNLWVNPNPHPVWNDLHGINLHRSREMWRDATITGDFEAGDWIIRSYDLHRIQPGDRRLTETSIDLVCMCGYLRLMRIDEPFIGRVINIHPALLPKFGGKGMYGLNVHRAVLAAGEAVTGCTVHWVDEHYDHGPTILQRTCAVREDDDEHTLAARVFEQECIGYPEAVRLFAAEKIRMSKSDLTAVHS